MTLFGLIWIIVLCVVPIFLGISIAYEKYAPELGFLVFLVSALGSLVLGVITIAPSEPTFSGGYNVPTYKRYYMSTNNGRVDVTKVITYRKCERGHLHTDVDYVFYAKGKNGGQVVRMTADERLKIEEYDGKPLIEEVVSYYRTGKMNWYAKLFWKEEESRMTTDGCPRVVRLYVPKGTKIKTVEGNGYNKPNNR